MLSFVALAFLQEEGVAFREQQIDGLLGPKSIMIRTPAERLKRPQLSPKLFGEPPKPWEFDWTSAGYVRLDGIARRRFDLYSQESTQGSARPEGIVRLLMRLFSYNVQKLRLDHAQEFLDGTVSVYLCYGGEAGGEQRFEVDRNGKEESKVNSIYFYDLRSFTDPVEILREVCHEYGHASLPAVGGYTEPENWANGYLGEKLYMSYLARALRAGQLTSPETFGATAAAVETWSKKNVEPLLSDAAVNGPRPTLLAGKGKASMDAYLGLALWTSQTCGESVLSRALQTNGIDAKNFGDSLATAAEEKTIVLNIPPAYRGKAIWIPVGKSVVRGAEEIDRKSKTGWVKIRPGQAPITVVPRP